MHPVLVVEDDPQLRKAIGVELRRIEVAYATTSLEAMTAIRSGDHFSVIVIDLHPDGLGAGPTGLAVARAAKQLLGIPAVMMSGSALTLDCDDCDFVIEKPWLPGELAEIVASAIARNSSVSP